MIATRKYFLALFTLFFMFSGMSILGQNGINDSLKSRLKVLEKIPGHENDTAYAYYLNELAFEIAFFNLDSMKLLSLKAEQLSNKIGYIKGQLQAKNNLGDHAMFTGNHQKALELHTETLTKAINEGHPFIALRSLNSLAFIHNQKSQFTEAYQSLTKGVAIAEEIGDEVFILRMNMNLGILFGHLNDFQTSMSYFNKCSELSIYQQSPFIMGEVLANKAFTYFAMENYDKALEQSKKAAVLFENGENPEWLAYCYQISGNASLRLKDISNAKKFIVKSDSIFSGLEDPLSKAQLELSKAEYAFLTADLKAATLHAESSLQTAKEIEHFDGQIEASNFLSKVYKSDENFELALFHNDRARIIGDSIRKENNKMRFAIEQLRSEEALAKQEQTISYERKMAGQRIVIYAVSSGLLVLMGLFLFIRRNNLKQRKTNENLRKINQTKDKLFSIIGHDLREPIGTLQEMLELYGSSEITDTDIARLAPRLKQNVDHSSFTLNNLLIWAQTQMDGIKPNAQMVPLKQKIGEICDLYQTRIKAKNIIIESSVQQNVHVLTDPVHLEIILRNIISNAIKFTPNNETITLRSINETNLVKLSICDHGHGIDQKIVDKILRGEYVEPKFGTNNEKGTGLGLHISSELVKINNGSLNISSKTNKGTCLHLALPLGEVFKNIDEMQHLANDTHKT